MEPKVTWGSDGFAATSGWALVYTTKLYTFEFYRESEVWISVGTGLPAGAFLDPPPATQEGKAIIRQNGEWCYVDDHRGKTAYNKSTRQSVVVSDLGPLSDALTLTPPVSQFDVWDETQQAWVKDEALEDAWLIEIATTQRQSLMSEASQEIAALVDALDPQIISDPSDADQVKLIAWKAYRVELSKIDQQSGYPDTINWPVKPQ